MHPPSRLSPCFTVIDFRCARQNKGGGGSAKAANDLFHLGTESTDCHVGKDCFRCGIVLSLFVVVVLIVASEPLQLSFSVLLGIFVFVPVVFYAAVFSWMGYFAVKSTGAFLNHVSSNSTALRLQAHVRCCRPLRVLVSLFGAVVWRVLLNLVLTC